MILASFSGYRTIQTSKTSRAIFWGSIRLANNPVLVLRKVPMNSVGPWPKEDSGLYFPSIMSSIIWKQWRYSYSRIWYTRYSSRASGRVSLLSLIWIFKAPKFKQYTNVSDIETVKGQAGASDIRPTFGREDREADCSKLYGRLAARRIHAHSGSNQARREKARKAVRQAT